MIIVLTALPWAVLGYMGWMLWRDRAKAARSDRATPRSVLAIGVSADEASKAFAALGRAARRCREFE